MKDIQLITQKVLELVSEIETYSFYKENLISSVERIFADYQSGRFTYFEYETAVKHLLKDKSKEEWVNYYNAYILSLLKRIEAYNSQIFYETYNNTDYLRIGSGFSAPLSSVRPAPKPVAKQEAQKQVVEKPVSKEEKHLLQEKKPEPVRAEEARPELAQLAVQPVMQQTDGIKLVEISPSFVDKIAIFFKRLFVRKEINERIKEIRGIKEQRKEVVHEHVKHHKEPLKKPVPSVPSKHKDELFKQKKPWFAFLLRPPKPLLPIKDDDLPVKPGETRPDETVAMGKFFGIDYIRNLLSRSKNVEFTKDRSEVPLSTIQLETLRRKVKPEITAQIEKITATALTKEAKRIRSLLEKRKSLKIYQPSFFGAVANIAIKKISLFLLDNFPDFFKDLYHALRLANIRILSNTYVNMMVLGVISSWFFGLFLFGIFFISTPLPFEQVIFRTIMMSFLMSIVTFGGFYAYPYSKMKQRRRSINTNLPFAINHMAAVSSSGVPPVKMFRLISESKEYGEVSAELEKIVNYIDLFGYDVLTALKAVAATTPSYHFKDFLEGMVSTTQTGGDIKSYFAQKAEEMMLNYKLERQKYTETISTYSDIYTGILIAAPLFFVAALSLVSLLGGKIGGMNVNVIIVLGTYIVIPLLNVAFLAFLEMTQPEV